MNFMTFHILGRIIPTDFHIFQRGRYTTNQIYSPIPQSWEQISRAITYRKGVLSVMFVIKCDKRH